MTDNLGEVVADVTSESVLNVEVGVGPCCCYQSRWGAVGRSCSVSLVGGLRRHPMWAPRHLAPTDLASNPATLPDLVPSKDVEFNWQAVNATEGAVCIGASMPVGKYVAQYPAAMQYGERCITPVNERCALQCSQHWLERGAARPALTGLNVCRARGAGSDLSIMPCSIMPCSICLACSRPGSGRRRVCGALRGAKCHGSGAAGQAGPACRGCRRRLVRLQLHVRACSRTSSVQVVWPGV